MMQKHFVTFRSPGTFVAEETTREIASWDVSAAVAMARGIVERHGSKPYGFFFTTRGRGPSDFDSREIARSPMHFLGGTVETLDQVAARNDPKEENLLWNMKHNGYARIVTTRSPWKWTQPLGDDDVVLEVELAAPKEQQP